MDVLPQQKTLNIDETGHPENGQSWRYVAFNAFVGGTRRVFVADMKELIS